MNDVNKELADFDANEDAQVADGHGLTPEQLEFAKTVIADERVLVENGRESADDAEDAVAARVNNELGLDDPEAEEGEDD